MKTKKFLIASLLALLLSASSAFAALKDLDDDANKKYRLSPPDGSFPLILKSDVNYAYDEEQGITGNPLYESNQSGDLTGVFIPMLDEKNPHNKDKELWKGEVYYLEYKESNGTLGAGNDDDGDEWYLRSLLKKQFDKMPSGRRALMWFGTTGTLSWSPYSLSTRSPLAYYIQSNIRESDNSTIIKDQIGIASYSAKAKLADGSFNGANSNVYHSSTGVGVHQKRMYRLPTDAKYKRADADFALPAPFFGLNDIINWRECTHVSFDEVIDIVGEARSYDMHPAKLLTGWLQGVDYKPTGDTYIVTHTPTGGMVHSHDYSEILYKGGSTSSANGMRELLPDLGKGSVALVGQAYDVAGTQQTGYNSFTGNVDEGLPRMLYFHTNDGLVRAINIDGIKTFTATAHSPSRELTVPGWGRQLNFSTAATPDNIRAGNESMAFMPPNVFHRKRLAQQKFNMKISDDKKLLAESWREDTPPSFLTDGDVILHNLQTVNGYAGMNYEGQSGSAGTVKDGPNPNSGNGWQWGTYITGMMGRGGAGMYTIQRTNSEFEYYNYMSWAVENNLYSFRPGSDTSKHVGETIFWTPFPKNATHKTTDAYYLYDPRILKYHPNVAGLVPSEDIVTNRPWNQKDYPGIHHGVSLPYKASGNPDYGYGDAYNPNYFLTDGDDLDGAWNYWRLGWNAPRPAFGTMEVAGSYSNSGKYYALTQAGVLVNDQSDPYDPDLIDRVASNSNINAPATSSTGASGRAFQLAIIPGGQQYYTDLNENGTIGAAIYISAATNGHILNVFSAYNRNSDGEEMIENVEGKDEIAFDGTPDPVMGMITTPVAVVARDKKPKDKYADRFLRSAFTADNRGNIFEVPFTMEKGDGKVDLYDTPWEIKARRVATLLPESEKGDAVNYIIPYRFAIAVHGGAEAMSNDLWICGGTANLPTVNLPDLDSKYKNKPLENKKQYIFGFNRPPHGVDIKDTATGHNQMSITTKGVKVESPQGAQYGPDDKEAWYIELDEDSGEYVSAPPLMYYGQLYVTTYLPKFVDGPESRYYVLNPTNGASQLSRNSRYHSLPGINVKGISAVKIGGKARIVLAHTSTMKDEDAKRVGADKIHENTDGNLGLLSFAPGIGNETLFQKYADYVYYWRRTSF